MESLWTVRETSSLVAMKRVVTTGETGVNIERVK